MLYNLGDKFYYKGMECVVRYINNSNAWLAPIEDTVEWSSFITIGMIDKKGIDADGNKATAIARKDCLAV